jgi:hypothetical protein
LGPLRILAFWLYGKKAINVTLKYDAILERMLKQHEESPKKENEDLMDILLKVYQDDKAEFKINRTHLKAFLLVSNVCARVCVCGVSFSNLHLFGMSIN